MPGRSSTGLAARDDAPLRSRARSDYRGRSIPPCRRRSLVRDRSSRSTFVHGLFSTAYFTCQRAVIPAIVGADEQRVEQREQPVEGDDERHQLRRPALDGVLIDVLGAANVMWIEKRRTSHRSCSSARSFGSSARYGRATSRAVCGRASLHRRRSVRASRDRDATPLGAASRSCSPRSFDRVPRLPPERAGRGIPDRCVRRRQRHRVVRHVCRARTLQGDDTRHRCLHRTRVAVWLLVPHVPLAVMITAMAIVGFANPMANAPIFGILTTRVPPAASLRSSRRSSSRTRSCGRPQTRRPATVRVDRAAHRLRDRRRAGDRRLDELHPRHSRGGTEPCRRSCLI